MSRSQRWQGARSERFARGFITQSAPCARCWKGTIMSQNDFASELTKMGFPSNLDASALAEQALGRNQRRIRTLAGLTIGLWAATFFLVPACFLPFAAMMKQKAIFIDQAVTGKTAPLTVDALAILVKDLCLHLGAGSIFILSLLTLA